LLISSQPGRSERPQSRARGGKEITPTVHLSTRASSYAFHDDARPIPRSSNRPREQVLRIPRARRLNLESSVSRQTGGALGIGQALEESSIAGGSDDLSRETVEAQCMPRFQRREPWWRVVGAEELRAGWPGQRGSAVRDGGS
jgi:hypothetical protein